MLACWQANMLAYKLSRQIFALTATWPYDYPVGSMMNKQRGLLMPTPGRPIQLGVRIPPELHKRLKLHCVQEGITIEEFTTEAIEEKLERDISEQGQGALTASGQRPTPTTRRPGRR